MLNQKELIDYRSQREDFIRWLIYLGKDPQMAEGYSRDTINKTAYRTEQLNRWVWSQEGGYTMALTHTRERVYAGPPVLRYLQFAQGEHAEVHQTVLQIPHPREER